MLYDVIVTAAERRLTTLLTADCVVTIVSSDYCVNIGKGRGKQANMGRGGKGIKRGRRGLGTGKLKLVVRTTIQSQFVCDSPG